MQSLCKYILFVSVAQCLRLLHLKQTMEWGNKVTIVETDMRYQFLCKGIVIPFRDWNAPEKADIIISELLGSFGDNELSPECLDGAQKVLKEDGISIPASYTSYIAPISSQRLHNEVKSWKDLVWSLLHC